MACVIAVDAGTTGVRSLALDERGEVVDLSYRQLTQHFPRPGWVEHDAAEIWRLVAETFVEVATRLHEHDRAVAAVGITNQRETVVSWDRSTGDVLHRAIVWQDRRGARLCEQLEATGNLPLVREKTGLVLDPYFSATKMSWLVSEGGVEVSPGLVLGTVDSWVTWNMTGGAPSGVVATDVTNASRTSLLDIAERRWSEELCELFGVPLGALAEVRPSCGRFGGLAGEIVDGAPWLSGVPVSGIAGDQQAALFGQACFHPGMAKATYGTGTFVLVNVGEVCPPPSDGLLTTVAWDLGDSVAGAGPGPVAYALEGSIFSTGAAIQWLRDGMGIIDEAPQIGPLAASVDDAAGVYLVPAFTGLGSPWWDPQARGAIVGISSGTSRAHISRAVVEAIALQVRDVVDRARASRSEARIDVLRVDGGASAMDLLLQIQADQLDCRVERPRTTEATALGAATLAGLAEGFWGSLDDLGAIWELELECSAQAEREQVDALAARWHSAVERSMRWAQ